MIQLENVHFIRHDLPILSNISLEMKEGEHWVILGRNGSGKTTLLELMTGYQFPSKGNVIVNGFHYANCDVREVRKNIGYISQSLLEKLTLKDPVIEVVATGEYGYLRFYEEIPKEVVEKALELIKWVGLSHLKDQPIGKLSQGERKKIMLARALISAPTILIMDEPCSGLDLYEREKLLETIEDLKEKNIQIVYVTHHIEEVIPLFTHVVLIEGGQVVIKGEKDKVLQAEPLSNAFGVPLSIDWQGGRPWLKVKGSSL